MRRGVKQLSQNNNKGDSSMKIYGEQIDEIVVDRFEQIEKAVRRLDAEMQHFLVCTKTNSDFIQVAHDYELDGKYIDFLVEVRLHKTEKDFKHYRTFNLKNTSEYLCVDTVIALFRSFYEDTPLSNIVIWEDITSEIHS